MNRIEPAEVLGNTEDPTLTTTAALEPHESQGSSYGPLAKRSRLANKRKGNQFESEVINVLKVNAENLAKCSQSQPKDPDEMFLLSQLPLIKTLNPSQKVDFHIKFMQLLQTYIAPTYETTDSFLANNHNRPNYDTSTTTSNSSFLPTRPPSSISTLEEDDESVLSFFNL